MKVSARLCTLAAAVLVLISMVSCSQQEEQSSIQVNTYGTDFDFEEGFVIPPTPLGAQYTYERYHSDPEVFRSVIDAAFGGDAWDKGSCTVDNATGTSNWYDEQEKKMLYMTEYGEFAFYDGKESSKYGEGELAVSDVMYADEFDSSVTLGDKSVSLNNLTIKAQTLIYDVLEIMRSDIELTPMYAEVYSSSSGEIKCVAIDYCTSFEGAHFSYARDVSDDNCFIDGVCSSFPRVHAYFYSADEVQGVWFEGMMCTNVKKTSDLPAMSCESALLKAQESKNQSRRKYYKIRNSQLVYYPTRKEDGVYTATPFWAFYYTNDHDADHNYGVFLVNAINGEVKDLDVFL